MVAYPDDLRECLSRDACGGSLCGCQGGRPALQIDGQGVPLFHLRAKEGKSSLCCPPQDIQGLEDNNRRVSGMWE